MATPKLQSLTKSIDQLEHDLEFGAGKLLDKIESIGARGAAAFAKSHQKVDGIGSRVNEIETFVAAVEKSTNGGDPLDGSSSSSEVAAEQPAATSEQHLTVNGASVAQ